MYLLSFVHVNLLPKFFIYTLKHVSLFFFSNKCSFLGLFLAFLAFLSGPYRPLRPFFLHHLLGSGSRGVQRVG